MDENNLIRFFRTRQIKAGPRRWGCLDEPKIAAYADHQLTGREKERAEAHLADCDYCLDQVADLVRMQNAGMPESVPEPLLARAGKLAQANRKLEGSTGWVWGKVAAATAVACLVVVTAISFRQSPSVPTVAPRRNPVTHLVQALPPVEPTLPVEPHPAVRGGQKSLFIPTVVASPGVSTAMAIGIEFRWQPVHGALDYEVIVLTTEGDQVWEQKGAGTSIRLPGGVGLQSGQKYFVTVRAFLTEGKSVQSAPVGFTAEHQ